MRFMPPEENISIYEDGFTEDILNRAESGKALSNFLERIDDPLVVALDGRWGSGKTYFLQRWVGAHTHQNEGVARTVYFDAFAHDYLDDPLIGLLSAVSARTPKAEQDKIEKAKNAAIKLSRPLARIALSMATFGATKALDDLGDAVAEASSREAIAGLDNFWKAEDGRQAAVGEFRSAIESLTSPQEGGSDYTPLIIVVDELDRCRPDYALEVLEISKHFFNVPRVHFVLGTNLEALQNSVKVRYGRDIDAEAYLKKFINVKFSLPTKLGDEESSDAIIAYAKHTGEAMGVPEKILEEITTQIRLTSRRSNISIRDIGKILSSTVLLPQKFLDGKYIYGYEMVTVTLICSGVTSEPLYKKFLNAEVTKKEIFDYFGASDEMVDRYLKGEREDEYDHATVIRCWMWMFISKNATLSLEDKERERTVARQFDSMGSPVNAHRIPKSANRSFIDILRLMR